MNEIIYRNPAEKLMWDFWMNLPIEAWYAFFGVVGLVILFLCVQSVFRRFKRRYRNVDMNAEIGKLSSLLTRGKKS